MVLCEGSPRTLAAHQWPLPAWVGLTLPIRLSFQENGEQYDPPPPQPPPTAPGLHVETCF